MLNEDWVELFYKSYMDECSSGVLACGCGLHALNVNRKTLGRGWTRAVNRFDHYLSNNRWHCGDAICVLSDNTFVICSNYTWHQFRDIQFLFISFWIIFKANLEHKRRWVKVKYLSCRLHAHRKMATTELSRTHWRSWSLKKINKWAFRILAASSLQLPGVFKPVADNRSQMSVCSVIVDWLSTANAQAVIVLHCLRTGLADSSVTHSISPWDYRRARVDVLFLRQKASPKTDYAQQCNTWGR